MDVDEHDIEHLQITPVFQGIGTHYADVWVGEPPQVRGEATVWNPNPNPLPPPSMLTLSLFSSPPPLQRAQRQTVIVDTGSHYTAFPCIDCTKCGEEVRAEKAQHMRCVCWMPTYVV